MRLRRKRIGRKTKMLTFVMPTSGGVYVFLVLILQFLEQMRRRGLAVLFGMDFLGGNFSVYPFYYEPALVWNITVHLSSSFCRRDQKFHSLVIHFSSFFFSL